MTVSEVKAELTVLLVTRLNAENLAGMVILTERPEVMYSMI